MMHKEQFTLEMTGTDTSAQNGIAESPNKTFGDMMQCILHTADLTSVYWSFALLHAVYIKNRPPYTGIKKTPFQALTGNKPDISNLCTFDSRIYAKNTSQRI